MRMGRINWILFSWALVVTALKYLAQLLWELFLYLLSKMFNFAVGLILWLTVLTLLARGCQDNPERVNFQRDPIRMSEWVPETNIENLKSDIHGEV